MLTWSTDARGPARRWRRVATDLAAALALAAVLVVLWAFGGIAL